MTDADPFEAFVRRYQDMVYATAVRLLGNPVDAEDVAQSVFLRAFERFPELRENPAAPGWLKTVARNSCLNHLTRYRARWRFFSELAAPDDDGSYEDGLQGGGNTPAADFEAADERDRLERAIHALPDHQRVPLVLFHFEGASYQEIADLLGASLGKIKTDIHRGREALRRHLGSGHAAR